MGFVKYKGAQTVEDFADKLLKEKGVLLMPVSIYDYNSNYFRIGFGRTNMSERLELLKLHMSNHKDLAR